MSKGISVIALALALVALGLVIFRPASFSENAQVKKETAFQRVMKSQAIRCAYIHKPYRFMIDPATGQKSGVDYEVMEEVGKLLHLKIDWVEETSFSTFPEQLNSGKEDVLCTAAWNSAARAARVMHTTPLFYMPLYTYVRDGDMRFDNNLNAINDEKVSIVVIDGGTMKSAADLNFPKAKQHALPSLTETGDFILDIATGKSDVLFFDQILVDDYNKNNPDKKLRRVEGVPPVRVYSEAYAIAMGEWELREMLNAAIEELHNNGTIERIKFKYEPIHGAVIPYAPHSLCPTL